MHHEKTRRFRQKAEKLPKNIKYNLFGTKTGRLTTRKSSFPIMTMNKEFRSVVKPTNSHFLELDFNAAEIRTLLALAGAKQPLEDIHAWNLDQGMGEAVKTRDDAKKAFFSWLYDEKKKNEKLELIYKRDDVRNDHFKDGQVTTPFGSVMKADYRHALSYLVQGTTAEMVLRQAIKIHNMLQDKQSFIAFTIHDSIILDMTDEECYNVPMMIEEFSNTELGKFLVNVKAGKDFGNLRTLNL